jgi:hypothetical protein
MIWLLYFAYLQRLHAFLCILADLVIRWGIKPARMHACSSWKGERGSLERHGEAVLVCPACPGQWKRLFHAFLI